MQPRRFLLFLLVVLLSGCSKNSEPDATASRKADPVRGRRIYVANCTTCHNADPAKEGSIGPAIQGSSQTLLQAKILTGRYPHGYTPKRKTSSMPLYTYLKSDIHHLAAYLATEAKKPSS
jgi:mono/diheme cytochrome c family protein